MACTTLEAIVKGCDNNIGSITKIYINDMSEVTAVNAKTTTWIIGSITHTSPFLEFEFR